MEELGLDKKYMPIGFFDSGVGGLSVLHEAIKLMPNENYIDKAIDKGWLITNNSSLVSPAI